MTARLVPSQPTFASDAERRVWTALRKKLPDEAALLHGTRFYGADGDWEADLIVLLPGAGMAVIEVKGSRVFVRDGQWWQRTPDGDKKVDPVDQARSGVHLVRRYLEGNPRWTHGRIRSAHLVAFPDTEWHDDLLTPATPRGIVITRDDLADAAGIVWDHLIGYLKDEPHQLLTADAAADAADLLGGRLTPQRDIAMHKEMRSDHVERLSAEQSRILDIARDNPRIEVVGGPGTGKTWLALAQARRLAQAGRRVAFIGYSRGLTTWARRVVDDSEPREAARVTVGTYHSLGVAWGAQIPDDRAGDADFWERELPAAMLDLARRLPADQRFDAIVVDEAQDFSDAWWPALLASMSDPDSGELFVCSDSAQRVFARDGGPDLTLARLRLDTNVRNTRQIAELFRPLGESALNTLGGEGLPIRFVPCTADEVYDEADAQAVALLDAGWEPRDIAVLTTHHRHPMQRARQEHDGREAFWDSFWDDDDYFYATVAGFKGLERPAVVLAVDGFRDPDIAREVLYVGLSRARDQLVVVGDLDVIAAAGGKELRKRLSKATAGGPERP
jgi:ATP:corrinoid adenosyltransferase